MLKEKELNSLIEFHKQSTGVGIDSRTIQKGQIYFGLKGERVNGSDYASNALANGAMLAVVDKIEFKGQNGCFYVENSLETLQELARAVRKTWQFPVLAIGGSNGKTSTKELCHHCLAKKFNVYSTPGNYNNHIGLPLTILNKPKNSDFVILELGANHLKEHAFLCDIALPNYGLLTNNGLDHLEGYGSLENVIKSNLEIYDFLRSVGGFVFVNADDDDLNQASNDINRFTYSVKNESQLRPKRILENIYCQLELKNGEHVKSNLIGDYNAYNIMAALAVSEYFEVNQNEAIQAVENYQPNLNRSQLLEYNGNKLIMDAYNANPSSMKLALEGFERQSAGNKYVILGGMRELGTFEKEEHQRIIQKLSAMDIERALLLGREFNNLSLPSNFELFADIESLKKAFEQLSNKQALILLKGSRAYALEELINSSE